MSVKLAADRETGQSKGFGHVELGDEASLEAAVQRDQQRMKGRPIKVAYATASRKRASTEDDADVAMQGDVAEGGESMEHGSNAGKKKGKKKAGCFVCGDSSHKSYDCPDKSRLAKRQRSQ